MLGTHSPLRKNDPFQNTTAARAWVCGLPKCFHLAKKREGTVGARVFSPSDNHSSLLSIFRERRLILWAFYLRECRIPCGNLFDFGSFWRVRAEYFSISAWEERFVDVSKALVGIYFENRVGRYCCECQDVI